MSLRFKVCTLIAFAILLVVFNTPAYSMASDGASVRASNLQATYGLSDEDDILLRQSPLNHWEKNLVAELSSISGESIAQILRMHLVHKLDWDAITSELGVDPSVLFSH